MTQPLLLVIADNVCAAVAVVLQGCVLEEYTQGVEGKLRALELESIQDYIAESDNLVDLHQQVRRGDHQQQQQLLLRLLAWRHRVAAAT